MYIDYIYTYISDIRARILHKASPKIHGYCCQNTCKSLGKPVKWNNWTLIYRIQVATSKNCKRALVQKLGFVISTLFILYIFIASMSLSQFNRFVMKILRPHPLEKRTRMLGGKNSILFLSAHNFLLCLSISLVIDFSR